MREVVQDTMRDVQRSCKLPEQENRQVRLFLANGFKQVAEFFDYGSQNPRRYANLPVLFLKTNGNSLCRLGEVSQHFVKHLKQVQDAVDEERLGWKVSEDVALLGQQPKQVSQLTPQNACVLFCLDPL